MATYIFAQISAPKIKIVSFFVGKSTFQNKIDFMEKRTPIECMEFLWNAWNVTERMEFLWNAWNFCGMHGIPVECMEFLRNAWNS